MDVAPEFISEQADYVSLQMAEPGLGAGRQSHIMKALTQLHIGEYIPRL